MRVERLRAMIADLKERSASNVKGFEAQAEAVRVRIEATAERIEKARAEAEEKDDRESKEDGFPTGYRKVLERMDAGEVSMRELMTGDSDDENVRKAHEWIKPRLEVASGMGRFMREGYDADEARSLAVDEYRAVQGKGE